MLQLSDANMAFTDEEDSDEDQTDLDAYNLLNIDKEDLIDQVKKESSTQYINVLAHNVRNVESLYWTQLLNAIINTYSMNYLRAYTNEGNGLSDMRKEVVDLLIFLKSGFDGIFNKKNSPFKRKKLYPCQDYVQKHGDKLPTLFRLFILFTDEESFFRFLSTHLAITQKF